MPIEYEYDEYWTKRARGIALQLFNHIKVDRIACIRSKGSKAKRVVARIHPLGKAMQFGMKQDCFYTIELLELFYKDDEREKLDTIIHELLHIPTAFGGGLKGHKGHITKKKIDALIEKVQNGKIIKTP